jgi:hypothetical protein
MAVFSFAIKVPVHCPILTAFSQAGFFFKVGPDRIYAL